MDVLCMNDLAVYQNSNFSLNLGLCSYVQLNQIKISIYMKV